MGLVLLQGCASLTSSPKKEHNLFFNDNSGSINKVANSVAETARTYGQEFADRSVTGSEIKMVGFAEDGAPYLQKNYYSHTLVLKVPTWKSRKTEREEIGQALFDCVREMPRTHSSHILEVIRFEGDLVKEAGFDKWHFVMTSDLMQMSENLQLTVDYLHNHKDDEIIERMLEVCPPADKAPVDVVVYWYPGLVNEKKAIDSSDHERIRSIFRNFLVRWSGGAEVDFRAMKESKEAQK